METKISFKRISMLVKANIVENYKVITTFWAIFTPIIGVLYLAIFSSHLKQGQQETIQAGVGLMMFLAALIALTILYINSILFKSSIKKNNISYKYALPAMVSEKYMANNITSMIIAPMLPIFSFLLMMIMPSIIFHVKFDNEPFFLFSVISQTLPSSMAMLNIICIFIIMATSDSITDIYWWSAKKTVIIVGIIIAFPIMFNYIEIFNYLVYDTKHITSYVIFPALAISTWILSYVVFKRKELKA